MASSRLLPAQTIDNTDPHSTALMNHSVTRIRKAFMYAIVAVYGKMPFYARVVRRARRCYCVFATFMIFSTRVWHISW